VTLHFWMGLQNHCRYFDDTIPPRGYTKPLSTADR
jgi:hypothetical protein